MTAVTQFPSAVAVSKRHDLCDVRNRGRFVVTSVLFAIYLIAHFAYLLNIGRVSWFSAIYLIAAIGLLVAPRIAALFALSAAANLGDVLIHLPIQSNHTLMSGIFCLGVVYAWLHQAITTRSANLDPDAFFGGFAPLGRWLLIGMYFYGVFHKINADFLNPEVSCAVVLWRAFGFPFGLGEWDYAHTAAIYGTFAVETFAAVCLLTTRFRHWGLLAGVTFHWLIGFNPYQDYIAFSLISILMHSLFFPPVEDRLAQGRITSNLVSVIQKPLPHACAIGFVLLLPFAIGRDAAWLLFGLALLAFIAIVAHDTGRVVAVRADLRPRYAVIGLLAAAFLANGMSPYLGLKTGQSISMFSNLTTEGGESNHLLMASVPQVFRYQDALAEIVHSDDPLYGYLNDRDYRFVEWAVLDRFERTGHATVYRIDGAEKSLGAADRERLSAELPSRFLRNLFVFKPVNVSRPRTCDAY